ncbi:hypothetical protein FXO37_24645 [Capsicum annuum]|nr:hypothetical protein FXO37_24645 [Capsicum annuum]
MEIITPFKVMAVVNKNGIRQSNQKKNGNSGTNSGFVSPGGAVDDSSLSENGNANIDPEKESNEFLWSKRKAMEDLSDTIEADGSEKVKTLKKKLSLSASTDKGNFDARTSGRVARKVVKCCSLSNGDIVVCSEKTGGAGLSWRG